ncbi:MAG: hypothetical protein LAO56_18460 [Acidobacteriia bacterium]|nr:hypothetical protein [Terriglobia bacterium]
MLEDRLQTAAAVMFSPPPGDHPVELLAFVSDVLEQSGRTIAVNQADQLLDAGYRIGRILGYPL